MQKDIERKIGEILKALHPYRHNLVVVGGICASIYHCEKKETITEQLFTTDLDLASEDKKIKMKEKSIRDLLTQLGFTSRVSRGSGKTVFELETEEGRFFEVEFLVPLEGSEQKQNTDLQPNVTGEKLRYIDLLYENAEMIELEIGNQVVKFQRPKPGVFIAHRALAVEKRASGEKKKKDFAYMIDLIHLFSDEISRLEQEIFEAKQRSGEHGSWIKKAKKKLKKHFLHDRDPLIYARERTEIDEVRGKTLVRDFLEKI